MNTSELNGYSCNIDELKQLLNLLNISSILTKDDEQKLSLIYRKGNNKIRNIWNLSKYNK